MLALGIVKTDKRSEIQGSELAADEQISNMKWQVSVPYQSRSECSSSNLSRLRIALVSTEDT